MKHGNMEVRNRQSLKEYIGLILNKNIKMSQLTVVFWSIFVWCNGCSVKKKKQLKCNLCLVYSTVTS